MIRLLSPANGRPLRETAPGLLSDGETLWPVVDGIPYLRLGREALREEVVKALEAGEERRALILLLTDQDDFSPTPPPKESDVAAMLEAPALSFRAAMEALNFGRVTEYFLHRWSAPTFLSGLALMGLIATPGRPLVELAAGTGQLIGEAARRGFDTAAADVVFAKSWLGKRFISPKTVFIACDAVAGPPPFALSRDADVFCHDAFYFFENKDGVLAAMKALAGNGHIGVGHAHTDKDPTGIAGFPLPEDRYRSLAPQARFFDDEQLTRAALGEEFRPEGTSAAHALSFVVAEEPGDPGLFNCPVSLEGLQPNPLLRQSGTSWAPHWPDERFAEEYRSASYLYTDALPPPDAPEATLLAAARRRLLLELPERWS